MKQQLLAVSFVGWRKTKLCYLSDCDCLFVTMTTTLKIALPARKRANLLRKEFLELELWVWLFYTKCRRRKRERDMISFGPSQNDNG